MVDPSPSMGPKLATKDRTRRTHSLGGCATCRRRHVKCDQVQPSCLTCKAIGVTCEGYSSKVQWVTPSTSIDKSKSKKDNASTTRRHLYTEQSRASMSTELIANFSSNSVDATLTEIDSWARSDQSTNSDTLAVGPFGVLNLNVTTTLPAVEPALVADELEADKAFEPVEELLPTPSTIDPLMSLDDSLQWADLFALDFGNEYLMQQDPFGPVAQDLIPNLHNSGDLGAAQLQYWNSNQPLHSAQIDTGVVDTKVLLTPVSPLADQPSPFENLIGDSQFLLRHFQDYVVDVMASVPYTLKSPWKSMNLSTAIQTLAELTFLCAKSVKHANAANMYSLISCSARHMATIPSHASPRPSDRWTHIADWAFEKAKSHLEQSMRSEFHGPGKAKYKDQLMATMGTLAACIMSGNQKDARRYMLEAERVLRLRGLAKRELSRRARLLHHIYTWLRIVGESTFVIHDYNSYAPVVQGLNLQHQQRAGQPSALERAAGSMNSNTGHNARLDDFLRLETQHDSDLEIDEPKEAAVGLHDIHLEDSRSYPASMYLQIYGIPETWLSLVSQTTRLANVMDTLKVSSKETNIAFQNALRKRASRLENMICSFVVKNVEADHNATTSNQRNSEASAVLPNYYMVQALNSALVIFFYRRIRDVNPWILQSHVDDVIKALKEFDLALTAHNIKGPGTAWAAFMAGCEALSPNQREPLLQWIQTGHAKSGMYSFKAAEEIMLEVWKKRTEANAGPSPHTVKSSSSSTSATRAAQTQSTWVETLREKNIWLMLC